MKTLKQWHEELGEEFYKTDFKSDQIIFSPKFICPAGYYHGLLEGRVSNWDAENPIWTIYTPPKPKVVRWLWASRSSVVTPAWHHTLTFYTEDAAKKTMGNTSLKLEWSRTEFED